MDLIADALHEHSVTVIAEHDRIIEIWSATSFLGVHSHQIQLLPDLLKQELEVQFHVATDHYVVLTTGNLVHLFKRNRIDLVVHVETLHVFTVS
jgi:hypothetical protein